MKSGDERSPLLDLIRGEIRASGPITYERYISLALHHPRLGYYRRGTDLTGDFITAPEVSPLFGRLLGRLVLRSRRFLPGRPLVVLEPGAGSCRLASAATAGPDLAPMITGGDVIWVASDVSFRAAPPGCAEGFLALATEGLAAFRELEQAVVVANELFDALPVRVVEFRSGRFHEILVGLSEDRLVEVRGEIGPGFLGERLERARFPALEGARYEVRPAAAELLREMARVVSRGLLVVLDYGGRREDLLARAPGGGTLRAFASHSVAGGPLVDPGGRDITADVDFDDLVSGGAAAGWELVHLGSQRDFMISLGLMEEVVALAGGGGDPETLRAYLAAKRFLMPGDLQERFRVLVLGRGLEGAEAAGALGLVGGES